MNFLRIIDSYAYHYIVVYVCVLDLLNYVMFIVLIAMSVDCMYTLILLVHMDNYLHFLELCCRVLMCIEVYLVNIEYVCPIYV
jgi:hypothetical protein